MHARRVCIKNMKKFRPWVFGLYNSTKIKKKISVKDEFEVDVVGSEES